MKLAYPFNGSSRGEGRFTLPTGEEIQGQIRLDPEHDRITLQINTDISPPKPHRSTIHGWVNEGDAVTLIGYSPIRSVLVQPRPPYVIYCQRLLAGRLHFSLDKHKIVKTQFRLSGSSSIFLIYANWVSPENRQKIIKEIIGESFSPGDPDKSFDRVYYCSGPADILSCNIGRYGQLSVRKSEVTKPSGKCPRIDVEFIIEHPPETSLDDAENAIQCVTRFFWLITGTRQYAENIRIMASTLEDDTSHHFDAYFPLQEAPISGREDIVQTDPHSLLINPGESRCEIEKCLCNWVELLSERKKRACDIILNQFGDGGHPPHRIALAVIAFEWFVEPPPDVKKKNVSKLVKEIVKFAKGKIEKKFPEKSPERKKVLKKLSQILSPPKTSPKLIDLIRYRLEWVGPAISDEMNDQIDEVVRDAVSLRHRYTHGYKEEKKLSPRDQGRSRIFLTQTLEFIFLASVLVECGWDMKSWNKREPRTLRHPFDVFVVHWSQLYGIWQKEIAQSKQGM